MADGDLQRLEKLAGNCWARGLRAVTLLDEQGNRLLLGSSATA